MATNYQDILDSLTNEKEDLSVNSKVFIVDGLNNFLRSFAMIQHVNPSGQHIGALTGFLKSMAYGMRLIRPTRVIVVFDGRGSSTNKRYLYPEYKANRGIKRITNWDIFDSQEEESDAIKNQLLRLVDYLKCLPIDLLSIDKIEADDVIGYISKRLGKEVTIMSSDRDYLQLASDRISIYSPTKKKFYSPKDVLKEYEVTSHNFLMQKVLLGDKGDNIPGVKGLGPKTLLKHFPELGESYTIDLGHILEKCKDSKVPMLQKIYDFRSQLEINKKLMDLDEPNIPEELIEEVDNMMANPNKGYYPTEFIEMYEEDQLGQSITNLPTWLYTNFKFLESCNQ
jgi:DNA polymerase I